MTMAMLAMAFAFSSCGDDDDETPGGGSAKEVRKVYIYDNGNQYLNRQYKLTVGSETKVLKLDELKKETAAPSKVESAASTDVNKAKAAGETVTIYSYDIPATMHGDVALRSDFSIKDGVELPEKVGVLIAGFVCVGNENSFIASGSAVYMGLMKEKVQEYLDKKNALKINLESCTVK